MFFQIVTRNLGWKVLSLGLAVIIWLAVRAISAEHGQTERLYLNVPVQIVSGTADVRAFAIQPEEVRVTLRGSPETIKKLSEREIRAFVDLTSSDSLLPFREPVVVAVPNGFSVVRVEPADVQVTPPPMPEPKIIISTNK